MISISTSPLVNLTGMAGRFVIEPLGVFDRTYLNDIDMVSEDHTLYRKNLRDERSIFGTTSSLGGSVNLIKRFGMCYQYALAHADELSFVLARIEFHESIVRLAHTDMMASLYINVGGKVILMLWTQNENQFIGPRSIPRTKGKVCIIQVLTSL